MNKLIFALKKKQPFRYFVKLFGLARESNWANVYHDSIRGRVWLTDLGLNVGRMAGNYTFFYVLHRILSDYRPKSVIEFGLGESTKMISTYLKNYLTDSDHIVVEHDQAWVDHFSTIFEVSDRTHIKVFPISEKSVKSKTYLGYEGIESVQDLKHDLYIIDGPFGVSEYSRYDALAATSELTASDEFIVVFDDVNRYGEYQTMMAMIQSLKSRGVTVHHRVYEGSKNVAVIATTRYKFATTL